VLSKYEVGYFGKFHIEDTLFLVGSYSAGVVLICGFSKISFTRPRNSLLSHVISTIVSVMCALLLSIHLALSVTLVISIAIFSHVYYCRSIA